MAAKRDKNGRFVKGHGGGPGRPKRSTEEKYLRALTKRVRLTDWEKVIDVAVSRAKAGDTAARQWLSDYLMGKPRQTINADIVTDNVFRFLGGFTYPDSTPETE